MAPMVVPHRRRYATYLVPLAIVIAWALITSGAFSYRPWTALVRVGSGLAVGGLTGAAVAVVNVLSHRGRETAHATLQMLRPLPFLVLAPLLVLLSDIGHAPSIALVALGSAWIGYFRLYARMDGTSSPVQSLGTDSMGSIGRQA